MEGPENGKCTSILIVEDDESIRTILSEILYDEGFDVFVAENGNEGLKILETIPRPCLILLDFMMPLMNGQEFMQKKQHDDLIAGIPVVLVSAFEDQSKEVGAVEFVKKPIELDGLIRFLKRSCINKAKAAKLPSML